MILIHGLYDICLIRWSRCGSCRTWIGKLQINPYLRGLSVVHNGIHLGLIIIEPADIKPVATDFDILEPNYSAFICQSGYFELPIRFNRGHDFDPVKADGRLQKLSLSNCRSRRWMSQLLYKRVLCTFVQIV